MITHLAVRMPVASHDASPRPAAAQSGPQSMPAIYTGLIMVYPTFFVNLPDGYPSARRTFNHIVEYYLSIVFEMTRQ